MSKAKYNLPITKNEMKILIRVIYNYDGLEYQPKYIKDAYYSLWGKVNKIEEKDKL